jgi:hypothetical protein
MEINFFFDYLKNKLYEDYLQKTVTPKLWAFGAFGGISFTA